MVGRIAPSGPWCNAKSAIANAEPEVDTPIPAAGIMGDGLTLYPNPASGLVTIKLPSSSHPGGALYIQVFGLQGNLVLSQQLPFNTLNRFDVGALPAGIYFVSAQHNGLIYRGKLVKTD
jgi:hypothetical protein